MLKLAIKKTLLHDHLWHLLSAWEFALSLYQLFSFQIDSFPSILSDICATIKLPVRSEGLKPPRVIPWSYNRSFTAIYPSIWSRGSLLLSFWHCGFLTIRLRTHWPFPFQILGVQLPGFLSSDALLHGVEVVFLSLLDILCSKVIWPPFFVWIKWSKWLMHLGNY